MSTPSSLIENISDTALWVAYYRAMETERPDAHFHDPYARMLAGERGKEIAHKMQRGRPNAWPMVVRTCIFDEIISQVIEQKNVDTILNLAAGLDTRPYRMPLPSSLRWIEVDLPAILTYKEEKLASEHPNCQLERVPLDLANIEARNDLFTRINAQAKQILVITEGFLTYLTPEQANFLATDMHAQPNFRWWLAELISSFVLKYIQKSWNKQLVSGNVIMQFAPEEAFFSRHGWKTAEFRSTLEEAHRLKRDIPYGWLLRFMSRFQSKERQEMYRRTSGYLLLERE